MKTLNSLITALALVSGSSAFAQLAAVDSGRFTTGLQTFSSVFTANQTLKSVYSGDLLILGHKLFSKERFIIGGGVGLLMNGAVMGENDQKFSDGQGERLFIQGQYGISKFWDSTFLYLDIKARREQFTFHQPEITVAWKTVHTQVGLQMAHRWGDSTMHEALHYSTYYRGTAIIPIPQFGTLKYKIERPADVELTIGASCRMDPSYSIRLELQTLQGASGMFALDYKI